MTEQQKVHPVFPPLDFKIDAARAAVASAKKGDTYAEQEAEILKQIEALQAELRNVRRRRESEPSLVASRQADLDNLLRVRAACESNSDIAQAVWLKLLADRTPQKKAK